MRNLLQRVPAVILFLLFAAVQGMWMLGACGPLSMPDAPTHIGSAWAVASGQVSAPVHGDQHEQTLSGPSNLFKEPNGLRNETVSSLLTSMIRMADNSGGDTSLASQRKALDRPSRTVRFTGHANQYMPVMFLPQAVGMKIAMLDSNWTSWTLLQTSRAFTLICYIGVGVLAVLLAGAGMWVMAVVLASPIPVFCAAAGMGDANVIAYCALYVAVFLALRRAKQTFGWRQTLLIAVLTIPLPGLKTVYATLALLYLTLPVRMWPWRQRLTAVGLFAIVAVPTQLWFAQRQLYWIAPGVDMATNRTWMLAHPLHTLVMLAANVILLILVVIWREWLTWLLPPLATAFVTGRRADKRTAITACMAAFLTLMLIFLSLALTWTPGLDVRGWHVLLPGFQERYLWPLLPLLAVGMNADGNTQELGRDNPRCDNPTASATLKPDFVAARSTPQGVIGRYLALSAFILYVELLQSQ